MSVTNQVQALRPVRGSVFGSTVLGISTSTGEQTRTDAVLAGLGLTARWVSGASQALYELRERPTMLCLLDCTRSGEALRVARSIRTERPQAVLVGIVDPNRHESSLEAFRAGVFDVLPSPHRAVGSRARSSPTRRTWSACRPNRQPDDRVAVAPYGVFGSSPAMRKIIDVLPRVVAEPLPDPALRRARHRTRDARAHDSRSRPPSRRAVRRRRLRQRDAAGSGARAVRHRLAAPRPTATKSGGRWSASAAGRGWSKPQAARCSCRTCREMPTRVQGKLHRVLRDREAVLERSHRASSSTSGRSRPSIPASRRRRGRPAPSRPLRTPVADPHRAAAAQAAPRGHSVPGEPFPERGLPVGQRADQDADAPGADAAGGAALAGQRPRAEGAARAAGPADPARVDPAGGRPGAGPAGWHRGGDGRRARPCGTPGCGSSGTTSRQW